MKINELGIEFVVKRAFRRGIVYRGDVLSAFDLSSATATRIMAEAKSRHTGLLARRGYGLKPLPLAEPPRFATEEALLSELDRGRNEPARTGLFDNELPVVYVSWTNSMPAKDGTLTRIINAIQYEHFISIVYVGLREGEPPRERRILPLALERMNDQWRVVAQDMDIRDHPIRIFVLSRVLEARQAEGRKPRGFVHQGHTDGYEDIHVSMNPRLNEHQKEIIARELRVENGRVRVAKRSLHEFERRFTDKPASPDAVWPPLVLKRR